MISQKYIKELDFKTIEDLFFYIIDSEINGNFSQFKELVKKLSNKQFLTFLDFCKGYGFNSRREKAIKVRNEVV